MSELEMKHTVNGAFCCYSIFSIYHIMLLNCSHRATVHIIPTDIIPSGMRKLSTNKHARISIFFVSHNSIVFGLIFVNFVAANESACAWEGREPQLSVCLCR